MGNGRSTQELTIRQRRRRDDIQDNLRKLRKESRKKEALKADNSRAGIAARRGVGRDYAAAAGGTSGGGVSGSYITTDGIFTLVFS